MSDAAEGECCPMCFHGAIFATMVDRKKRCGSMMSLLLRKRVAPGDVELATAIDREVWP